MHQHVTMVVAWGTAVFIAQLNTNYQLINEQCCRCPHAAKSWFHGQCVNHDNDQGWMQLLLYCLHITGQQRWIRQPTREATDDDIKRCDADGNPRKPVGSAQPADVRRCSVIGDGEGEGDGVT
jgi:hypothetical protein